MRYSFLMLLLISSPTHAEMADLVNLIWNVGNKQALHDYCKIEYSDVERDLNELEKFSNILERESFEKVYEISFMVVLYDQMERAKNIRNTSNPTNEELCEATMLQYQELLGANPELTLFSMKASVEDIAEMAQ